MRKLRWAPNASHICPAGKRRSWDVKPALGSSRASCARVKSGYWVESSWRGCTGVIRAEPGREAWESRSEGPREFCSATIAEPAHSRFGPYCSGCAALGLPWGLSGRARPSGPESGPWLSSRVPAGQPFLPRDHPERARGHRRPSVTCSWAASRTRRLAQIRPAGPSPALLPVTRCPARSSTCLCWE